MNTKLSTLGIGVLLVTAAAPVHATLYNISANLSGLNEVPPNASPAFGTLTGTLDDVSNQISFLLTYQDLVAPSTAAHLHGPAAVGVNGPVFLPINIVAGTTSGSVNQSSLLTPTQVSTIL